MKRNNIIFLVIISLISSIFLSGCQKRQTYDETSQVKKDIYRLYDDLKAEAINIDEKHPINKMLLSCLRKEGLSAKETEDGAIITDKKKKTAKKESTVTFLANYSSKYNKEEIQVWTIAIATIKNLPENKNACLILIPKKNKEASYKKIFKKIPEENLKNKNIVDLTWNKKTTAFVQGSETFGFYINKHLNYIKPKGSKAFRITISGLEPGDSGDLTEKHNNPIVYLSEIIASMKSGGLTVELAKFHCKGKISDYPVKAYATIVVDESAVEKVETKLENSANNFRDINRHRAENAALTFKPVKCPRKSLNYNDTAEILSLLYTLKENVLATSLPDEEGEPLAITNISSIHLDKKARIQAIGRSVDPTVSSNMLHNFRQSANLSDFSLKSIRRYKGWNSVNNFKLIASPKTVDNTMPEEIQPAGNAPLTTMIIEHFDKNDLYLEPKNMFQEGKMSALIPYLSKKSQIISMGININDSQETALAFITLIDSIK